MSHPVTTVFPPEVLRHLDAVEERLRRMSHSREARLDAWCREPIESGGKRVRPLLLLTAFHACGGDKSGANSLDRALDAAVALELIHTASLVHDDIMDEATERRGNPSTYAAHGRDAALLVGDYFFTQAFSLSTRMPARALELTSDACRRLCEGQVREQQLLAAKVPDREKYLAVIRDKTASLLSAGCAIGGAIAGADEATIDALYRYGDAIGHAFQILDDVLDVAGDPAWTGKPAGTDFVAGTLSSPYLNYLDRGGELPPSRAAAEFPRVRAQLFETGAVAASQLEASGYTQAALLALEKLPPTQARDALARLAELLMERAQ
jgi:octaprenyl-diphosphate synthase